MKKTKVRVAWRQCNTRDTVADDHGQAQREVRRVTKIRLITILLRRAVSEIKLKRTDTTLDLSQKAKRAEEKKKKKFQRRGGSGTLIYPRGAGPCTSAISQPRTDHRGRGPATAGRRNLGHTARQNRYLRAAIVRGDIRRCRRRRPPPAVALTPKRRGAQNVRRRIAPQRPSSSGPYRQTAAKMSMFRSKKLDIGCFTNIRIIRDHSKRKAFEAAEPERCLPSSSSSYLKRDGTARH